MLPFLLSSRVLYIVVTVNVGRAREKYKVPAPQMSGNPDFERVLRVQQNTLEQMVLFLPGLWIFSLLVDPKIGAGIGGVWVLGRILYAWGYYRAAEKRGPGFIIGTLAGMGLLLGTFYGAIKALMD